MRTTAVSARPMIVLIASKQEWTSRTFESILAPNAYISPGYPANAMPQNFGERLDLQQLADLVAYLESQDGPDPLAAS